MTDRDAHRAAVDAGYASLAEYIKKWGDDKMDLLQRLREYETWSEDWPIIKEAADEIERLWKALKDKDELIQYLEGHIDGLKKFVVQQKETE